MNTANLNLSYLDLAIAATLILVNVAISLALSLDFARKWMVAGLRTVVQLLLIGYVLDWVFAINHWHPVVLLLAAMTVIAGWVSSRRSPVKYAGMITDGMLSVWISAWLVTAFGLYVVMRIDPWFDPKYAIPVMGIVLGNVLTGVALGLERVTEELDARRDQIETLLALGASRWEAFKPAAQNAVRAATIPVINALTVVGIVSLPGVMTGQVLAGQSPDQAIRYQIVIMFLISAASGLGTACAVLLAYRRMFDPWHRFRYWRLERRKNQ